MIGFVVVAIFGVLLGWADASVPAVCSCRISTLPHGNRIVPAAGFPAGSPMHDDSVRHDSVAPWYGAL
jgi:hypothetical protein